MRLLAIVIVLLASPLAAEEKGTVWAQHRGNSGSTGVSLDDSVKPPLRLVWSYRCDSDTTGDAGAGLTVGGGKVFCNMIMTRSILALDAETGAFCWEFKHGDVHYQQTSSYAGGKLFVWLRGYGRSTLAALDVKTGKPLWQKKLASTRGVTARRSGPAVAEGKVLVADGDGTQPPSVICFSADSGEEMWRTALGGKAGKQIVAPSIAAGKVFTGTRVSFRRGSKTPVHGAAVALNLADGKPLWRNEALVPTRPLVSDGKIVVCKFNGQPAMPKGRQKLSVLDAATGREIWGLPIWIVYGTTTITNQAVILKYYGARMVAYDRQSGEKLWESRYGGGSGCSSPSISGKYAFVGTGSFNDSEGIWAWRFASPPHAQKDRRGQVWSFHAIDLDNGKSVWHCVTGNNACGDPAIAYGRLYVNSRDGRIYCYAPTKDGGPPQPDSPDDSPHAAAEHVRKLLDQPIPAPRPNQEGAELDPPLAPSWTLATGGRIVSSPVAHAGGVYVSSLSGKIIRADLKTGVKRWEFQTGGEIKASPAVAEDAVYCGSDDGKMYALSAADGKKLWEYRCGGPVQCSPAVSGGVLFFGANDYHFYALDRKTGQKLWSFKTTHPLVIAAPVAHGDTVFAAQWVDWVYALDAVSGKVKWKDCAPISIESLHFYRGKLYLRSPRQVAEYDPADGRRLRLANAVYGYNGLAFLDGLVITAGVDGANVVDLSDKGSPSRHQDQPALKNVRIVNSKRIAGWRRLASMGTPLAVGDAVCFASLSGEVHLIRPDRARMTDRLLPHKTLWTAKLGGTCHSSPIAAGGMLLVGCDDGVLYAFAAQQSSP